MKTSLSVLAAALAAAAPLASAHAQPSSEPTSSPPAAVPAPSSPSATAPSQPSIGIGLGQTLDGTQGLSLRYGRRVQLELVLGGGRVRQQGLETSNLDVAARILVPLIRHDSGWIGAVVGASGHRYDWENNGYRGSKLGLGAEAGLHAEWFVLPALSLGLEVGASVTHDFDGRTTDPDGDSWDTEDGRRVGIGRGTYGGAGSMTYWFDADDERRPSTSGVRFGVGVSKGIGTTGVALDLDLGRLRLQAMGRREDASTSSWSWTMDDVSAGAVYEVARRGPVALSSGLRLGVHRFDGGGDGGSNTMELGVEVPVRIEVDATQWLSLHGEGGLELRTDGDHDRVSRAGMTGATGAVGFTVWL